MATLTLKNVPEELVENLKAAALESRRSLNQEALMRLELSLVTRPQSSEEKLAIMKAARASLAGFEPLTAEFVQSAKAQGRR